MVPEAECMSIRHCTFVGKQEATGFYFRLVIIGCKYSDCASFMSGNINVAIYCPHTAS